MTVRTWGAVLPVRLGSPEDERNLRAVLRALAAGDPDEVCVVEQIGETHVAQPPREALPSAVRHVRVPSRREAFERGRLVNQALRSMTTDWICVCDPNLVLPFRDIAARLGRAPNVAIQLVSEIARMGRAETEGWFTHGALDRACHARPAPFGKATYGVDREVLLALGGLSEAFLGAADEGFELLRRLKRFFTDLATHEARGITLWAPRPPIDRLARADNRVLAQRLGEAIDADVERYLTERFDSSLTVDLGRLRALSRERGRAAAFRVTHPTTPRRLPRDLRGEIWGVTTFFNPAGYASKRENYLLFREGLARDGLRLLAVELAFDDAPFELTHGDADQLVQIRSDQVLWQKERLLNVGIRALPAACDRVAWLDADILFERPDWVERTAELLRELVVVQPFTRSVRLRARERTARLSDLALGSGEHEVLHGMAYGVQAKGPACLDRYLEHGHSGYAWAARRDVLTRHGLYDGTILGSGDLHIAHAMFAGARHLKVDRLSERARAHLEGWSQRFHADVQASVGSVDGTVFHLWHGDSAQRRYLDRLGVLIDHDFDPERDLVVDASGAYRFASDKPGLRAFCREYFLQRREDG